MVVELLTKLLKLIIIHMTPTQLAITSTACLLLAASYLIWLNAGCELIGVMTWHGKECINFDQPAGQAL